MCFLGPHPCPLLTVEALFCRFSIVRADAPNGQQQTVEDAKSLARSAAFVLAHIQAEVDKGIDPSRILLVGFGQGGATALMAACHTVKHRVGGVICIAGELESACDRCVVRS